MSRHQRLKQLNPVFHMKQKSEDNQILTRGMIKQALKSGCLNLSGRGLAFGEYKNFLHLFYNIHRSS